MNITQNIIYYSDTKTGKEEEQVTRGLAVMTYYDIAWHVCISWLAHSVCVCVCVAVNDIILGDVSADFIKLECQHPEQNNTKLLIAASPDGREERLLKH